jgi:phytoene dehydrogenase-like protein
VTALQNFRTRGSSGKVNIALSKLPNFSALPFKGNGADSVLHRGAVSISPSIDYIERAYDDAKYGQISKRPYLDMIFPSMIDPDMAPPGQHVMSCFVQYAPYDIEGGWDDAKRDQLGEAVIATIEEYAPNIRECIVGMQVISPKDIERIAGITGGNIFHGELLLHQIFFLRPYAAMGRLPHPAQRLLLRRERRAPRRRSHGRGRDVGGEGNFEGW